MPSLTANPKRQAIASLKGYSYQIWQSLFRWFELASNQELFLEGAEDLDLLGPGTAETVQVKNTLAPVTLRSSSIIDAINNFWQHRESNPSTVIIFRFLTTAPRAVEQGKPFGDEKGLDVWDRSKSHGIPTEKIREFLLSLPRLSDAVKAFIEQAEEEEFRQDLISRIEWDTDNENQIFLEEIIDRKVVEYGQRIFNLPPSESRKVAPHLLAHVWQTVLKPNERLLRSSDLAEIFEKATMELVPKIELEKLREHAKLQSPQNHEEPTHFSFGTGVIEDFSAPYLGNFVERTQLGNTGRLQINSTGILMLTGMTGMGKSILASQIITGLTGNWVSINFRGLVAHEIASRLDFIARNLEDTRFQADFLLDDLNFDHDTNLYEKKVEKVLYLLKLRRARVIFTSQNRMPPSIIGNCDIRADSIVNVPLMEFSEIEELARLHGADATTAERWKTLIAAQTGRHPVLVHAQIRGLQFRNWTKPPITELFKSDDVDDVRLQFRKTLNDSLEPDARELLYRLSVFFNRFNRRQALELAQRKPPIGLAGEVFDQLIGPWIEPDGREHFRLSPLLSDAADKVLPEKEVKKLHAAAASSYLKEKSISPQDANSILMHGIRGNNPFPMIALVPKLFGIEPEHKDSVYELLSWFPLVNGGAGQTFFEGFKLANMFLRQLQFTIQAHLYPDKVSPIIERWEQELAEPEGPADIPGTTLSYKFTFLTDLLIHTEAKLTPENVARYLTELNVLLRREERLAPTIPEYDGQFWGSFKELDNIGIFLGASVARFRDGDDIIRMLVALQKADAAATNEMWQAFETDVHLTTLAVDRLWLDEAAKESPSWKDCLSKLDLLSEIGIASGVKALTAASLRAKAIVYEEYLKQPEVALKMLSQAEQEVGEAHPLVEEYRARILFFRERYAEALVVLDGVIEQTGGDPPGRYVVYRDAEMCAARLGRWSDAADYASLGSVATLLSGPALPDANENEETRVFAMTFQADRAYCLWKAGAKEASILEFCNILEQFEKLTSIDDDIRAPMLYRRVGYAIGWLVKGEKMSKDAPFEPQAGWFSDFTLHEDIKTFPMPPMYSLWLLLAELQIKSGLGTVILDKLFGKQFPSDKTAILWLLKFKDDLSNGDATQLPEALFELLEGTDQIVTADDSDRSGVLIEMMTPILVRLICDRSSMLNHLVSWRENLQERHVLTTQVADWLSNVEEVLSMQAYQLSKCLGDSGDTPHRRLLAAMALSADKSIDPEARLYANAILVTNQNLLLWKDELAEMIEEFVVDGWKYAAFNQRFALVTPQSTVPEILTACEDTSRSGIAKAANIVLAAVRSVRLRIDESLLDELRTLSHVLIP